MFWGLPTSRQGFSISPWRTPPQGFGLRGFGPWRFWSFLGSTAIAISLGFWSRPAEATVSVPVERGWSKECSIVDDDVTLGLGWHRFPCGEQCDLDAFLKLCETKGFATTLDPFRWEKRIAASLGLMGAALGLAWWQRRR